APRAVPRMVNRSYTGLGISELSKNQRKPDPKRSRGLGESKP
ncbi:hypothetical protein chiPu_0009203, partial [Chiloscyllium punctatum]|nr:hypothetical protein [Chiloscyllium punctatum]